MPRLLALISTSRKHVCNSAFRSLWTIPSSWKISVSGAYSSIILVDRRSLTSTIITRESEITLERIRKILAAGANVVLTTKGIDDLCLKEFVEAGAMAVRRCRKEDLRRIAKATGGTLVSSLANLEGDESFEPSYLGYADEVVQERISDDELILIKGTKVVNSSSIVLRGANDYMLDEMERALHDTLSIIKRTLESGSVVPGGGAVETALSIYLENFATTLVSALTFWSIPGRSDRSWIPRVRESSSRLPSSPVPSWSFPRRLL